MRWHMEDRMRGARYHIDFVTSAPAD